MHSEHEKIRDVAFKKLADGDVKAAFSCISGIISTDSYTIDDLYLAGQLALDSALYAEAIELLTRTLSESTIAKETWYIDSTYIARAYARVLIGEYKLAREDLAQINDDVELSWLLNHPRISKFSLLEHIKEKMGT